MKCDYCGAEVPAGEIFCRNCGTRHNPALQAPAPQPAAAPVPQATAVPRTEPAAPVQPAQLDLSWLSELPGMPDAPAPVRSVPREEVQLPPMPQPVQEQKPAYVPYGAPEQSVPRKGPVLQLPTERSLVKMIFLGLLTLGIYPVVIWSRIVTELNIAASRYDGERTVSYFGACMLAPVTLMVYPFVWMHGFCRRIGTELNRRGIRYKFGASTFWLWNVLGSLILVGPFIFTHKLMKAMNQVNRDFNVNG